ncbi:beta strand repeat-containing protein, partial [Patescibacteria group bacterium]
MVLAGADRNIQTTLQSSLILGGNTTGDILLQPNADTGDYLKLTSDATDLTLTTTDASGLTISPTAALTLTSAGAATWSSSTGALVVSGDDGLTLTAANTAGLTLNSTAGTLLLNASGQIINIDSGGEIQIDGGLVDIGTGTYALADGDNDLGVAGDLEVVGNLVVTDGSGNYTGFTAQAMSGDQVYTLPAEDGSTSYLLQTNGGGVLNWVDPALAGAGSVHWSASNGAIYPKNSTMDVFIGGQASDSANFAFLNNNTGTPTASFSGNLTLNSAGVIQTTENQLLTIGGNTTGDIYFNDNVGIGTASPGKTLEVAGDARIGGTASGDYVDIISTSKSLVLSQSNAGSAGHAFEIQVPGWTGDYFAVDTVGEDIFHVESNGNSYFNTGGNLGIGEVAPSSILEILSSTSPQFTISYANGTDTTFGTDTNGDLTITPSGADLTIAGDLIIGNSGTTTFNAIEYTWPDGVDINNYILQSQTDGTLAWVDPAGAAASAIYWNQSNGALYPKNSTVDVLFGGQASDSANFAFINNNTGTPTASISGNLTLNSVGEIQTTNNQLLTIGGSQTGDLYIVENVGIGTNAPSESLDVYGDGKGIKLRAAATTGATNLTFADTASRMKIYKPISSSDLRIYSLNGGIGDMVTFDYDAGYVGILQISPISQLSIGAGSNVAVTDGTTATSVLGLNLSITDDAAYAAGIYNSNADGDGLLIQAGDASDDFALRVEDYDSANDLFVVRGDGNVGIGTDAPNAILEIAESSGPGAVMRITDTGDIASAGDEYGRIEFYTSDGSTYGDDVMAKIRAVSEAVNDNYGNLSFQVRTTGDGGDTPAWKDAMYIQHTGYVGLTQTSPATTLSIGAGSNTKVTDDTTDVSVLGLNLSISDAADYAAGIYNSDASGDGLLIQAGDQANDYALRVEDFDSANDLFVVRGDGLVGIGTAAPLEALDVQGNATVSGNLVLAGADRNIQTTIQSSLILGGNTTGDILFQPNADTTNYLQLTSDATDLTLATTDGAELNITPVGGLDIDVTGAYDMLASTTFSIDGTGASNVTA